MADELLARLRTLRIDDAGSDFSFLRRLAHENHWSERFATRVFEEYLRFVWLAVRAGHPVTPSPAVDEAWHLHLCYTRSYWQDLCGRVIGRPLHHGPTRGGSAEAEKFASWYARTLRSYREHFGPPPADIWPPVEARFRGGMPRRVDARTHWVVPKRTVRRALAASGAGVLVLVAAGCSRAMDDGVGLVLGTGILSLVAAMVFWIVRSVRRAAVGGGTGVPRAADDGGGCAVGGKHAHDGDSNDGDGGGDAGGCGGGGCGD